jgi:hypothetical protein
VLNGKPLATQLENTPKVMQHLDMCKERVSYFYDIAVLEVLQARPEILQPLHVITKPGKKPRLVLDLSRNLNEFVEMETFPQKTFQDAVEASTPGCYYGKMDLADCFFSFPVHKDSRHLLAFELDGVYYRFRRLAMGLCSSPEWCQRFLEVIDFELERLGIKHVRMTDDFLFIGHSPKAVQQAMNIARRVLLEHGLEINETKTEGPTQKLTFLGLGLDSVTQTVFVPKDKLSDLFSIIGTVRGKDTVTRYQMQSLVGKFSFVATALPGARPFFRHLIDASSGLASRHSRVTMTAATRDDLDSWSHWLTNWNGQRSWVRGESIVITHDASGGAQGGFGFFLKSLPADFSPSHLPDALREGNGFAGVFSDEDSLLNERSIQYGELFAMATSVAMFAPYLKGRAVLLETDNETDVHIINRQSTACPDLLRLLRYIYATCAHYNIDIWAKHVAGANNVLADYLSRPTKHMGRTRVPVELAHNMHTHFIHSSGLRPPSPAERSTMPTAFSMC